MKFRKELLGGTTGTLILSILSRSPAHGYEIVRAINEESSGLLEWKEATIYPALHRLEKSGYLKGHWQEIPNGRKRRVYSLTSSGKKALNDQSREWEQYSSIVDRVLGVNHG
ncbi:MAG: PadR family transcriptional regulator [Candidatus Omnitrophica bacterium]|nr:PadR family transcriptional regulator [Candidatus Omnitrophota bacterium]MCA9445545.1 PadR family transcriptional regulator [Candidatus Omnitrophota bacterium]